MSFAPASVAGLERAIAGAASISLSAYVLDRHNALVPALEAAAERGAAVAVVLDGMPIGASEAGDAGIARSNAACIAELRAHGVDARASDGSAYAMHLKAAVVDGRAYLDERNWTPADTLVATGDPAEVACVRSAIAEKPSATADLALTKPAALAVEASAIAAGSGDRVDCASESFGSCGVSAALERRAAAGAHVRLVVSERALRHASQNERHALARLAAAGVDLRAGPSADKLCVAGDRAWLGSANATFSPPPPMLDWGLATRDPALVAAAAKTFAADWAAGRPIDAASLTGPAKAVGLALQE